MPDDGEILVTGASGGVGSIAVILLNELGYKVTAVTGKSDENVQEMLDYMKMNYEEIVRHSFTHPDYIIHLFNALFSSKNDIFRSMIQRERDKWELGEDILPDSLVEKVTTKYNNMVLQNIC